MPLPARPRRISATGGCARPNCHQTAVITLGWGPTVLSFCASHAEDKAGQDGVEIRWLMNSYAVCPRCARVTVRRLLRDHFNLQGEPCVYVPEPR